MKLFVILLLVSLLFINNIFATECETDFDCPNMQDKCVFNICTQQKVKRKTADEECFFDGDCGFLNCCEPRKRKCVSCFG